MGRQQDDGRTARTRAARLATPPAGGAGESTGDAVAERATERSAEHATELATDTPVARTALARALWVGLGWLCVAIGAVGVVVPGLPTTPFLVLAAACFVRGSTRLYARLIEHPRFGPLIRDFRAGHGIPARVKVTAIATMVVFVGFTLGPGLPAGRWDLRGIVLATALIGAGYLLSLPSTPRQSDGKSVRKD